MNPRSKRDKALLDFKHRLTAKGVAPGPITKDELIEALSRFDFQQVLDALRDVQRLTREMPRKVKREPNGIGKGLFTEMLDSVYWEKRDVVLARLFEHGFNKAMPLTTRGLMLLLSKDVPEFRPLVKDNKSIPRSGKLGSQSLGVLLRMAGFEAKATYSKAAKRNLCAWVPPTADLSFAGMTEMVELTAEKLYRLHKIRKDMPIEETLSVDKFL